MTSKSSIGNFSDHENGTSVSPHSTLESSVEVYFKCVAYVLIVVFSVVGNSFVITAFKLNTRGKLRTVNNMFIMSMAAGDLLLTMGSTPERITRVLADDQWLIGGILGVLFCKLANFIEKLCMNVAILHLSMIAIDRFLVVFYPHKKIITKKRALWMIITAWLASIVFCAPLLYYANTLEKNGQTKCKTRRFFPNWRVWYIIFLSLLMLTLVFVISLYLAITIHVRTRKRPGMRISGKNARLRSRILKMVLLIVLAFYICFLPYWMGWLFCVYYFTGLICNKTYVFISILLIYANSAINPVIYSFFNENFRLAFYTILGRLCGCYRSSQESMITAFGASNNKKENPRQNPTQISGNAIFLVEKNIKSTRV
ncbi:galanin receptor type 1-like [Montipora capricornis]|uniref:galanin receptor type 1-like n=1 Tax=Montipora capricornis TaxID=246305 RepID=UPI0035F1AD6C